MRQKFGIRRFAVIFLAIDTSRTKSFVMLSRPIKMYEMRHIIHVAAQ